MQLRQLPTIAWPQEWGIAQAQGQGQARIWADVVDGQWVGASTDMALEAARVQWRDPARPPLALADVQGRVAAQWQTQAARASWAIQAQRWALPGSRPWAGPSAGRPAIGGAARPPGPSSILRLHIAQADVGLARQLVAELPVPAAIQAPAGPPGPGWAAQRAARALEPRRHNPRYQASGQIAQLHLQSQPAPSGVGTPGVSGAEPAV